MEIAARFLLCLVFLLQHTTMASSGSKQDVSDNNRFDPSSEKFTRYEYNDVLDLSKIEAGKLELQFRAVSIQNLFEEMSAIFQHRISDRGLELEVKVDADLPESLLLDETRG